MHRRTLTAFLMLLVVSACSEGQDTLVGPAPDEVATLDANQVSPDYSPVNLFDFWTPPKTRGALGPMKSILPTSLSATLLPGEVVTEHKDVSLPAAPPIGDVIFTMDLTGSMGGELSNVKVNSANIMTAVAGLIPDAWFGVISYADYNGFYNSSGIPGCSYAARYGSGGDFPYKLDQAVTSSQTDVVNALNGLYLRYGNDGPESYLRALYEAYADGNVGWRSGAKRILVNFGDNIPHDCTLGTGRDPGRDNAVGTGDDLTIANVKQGLIDNNVTLIHLNSGGSYSWWNGFASATGGTAFQINGNGTFPGGIDPANTIAGLILAQVSTVNSLSLQMCAGSEAYASWLQSVSPTSVGPLTLPDDADFDIVVGPPAGTPPGDYSFEICAIGDGAEFGRQTVDIHVPAPPVADAGEDAIVECAGCSAMFTLDGSGSAPGDAPIASYEWTDEDGNVVGTDVTADVALCLGSHTYTLTVTDELGLTDSDDVTVTVEDQTPPTVSFTLSETTLWSPNHKMVTVATGISAFDACDADLTFTVEVTSNEPINGLGDGNTEPDWIVVDNGDGTFDLQLRAERAGNGTGRIYYITVTATDDAGNVTVVTGEVTVPHSQGKKGGQ